jgi:hypothetical protein
MTRQYTENGFVRYLSAEPAAREEGGRPVRDVGISPQEAR